MTLGGVTSGGSTSARQRHQTRIAKADEDLQIVWGEVYVPGFPDSQGDFMTVAEVRKMAHRWLTKGITEVDVGEVVDVNHDGKCYKAYVVESFIARKNDPDGFIEGSWVVGVKIEDPGLWGRVKKGELNGFSMEAMVMSERVEIEVDMPDELSGVTLKADDHVHQYRVWLNADGQIVGGETDFVNGHRHTIKRGTVTEEALGHRHKWSFLDTAPLMVH